MRLLYFRKVQPGMDSSVASGAVNSITGFMQRYFGKNVIILLDEYDSPMQAAWLSGYWDKAVSFFNGLFNSTFKTNPYLYRGGDNWNYKSCEKEYFFRTE